MSQLWSLIIRVVEESSGNDPQSVSHRSHCLANKSRRLQGLLSIVLIIGLEPITSDVSDRRSHQLSYMSGCGLGRGRTYDLRVNSSLLCHWATSPFCCGSRWNRTTKTMFYRHDQDPADTPLLYTLQGSNLWPVVCKTTATTIWAKSACFSFSEQN